MSRPPSQSSSSSSTSSSSSSSSASSSSSISTFTSNSISTPLARVHGHDHNRPLPPPRLPEILRATPPPTTVAPLTAPLTPLSGIVRTSSRAPAPPPPSVPAPVPVHDATPRIATSPSNDLQGTLQNSSPRTAVLTEVTLTVPRPDGERAVNEYVETPFRPNTQTTGQKCPKSDRTKRNHHHLHHHHHHHHLHHHQSLTGRNTGTGSPEPPSSSPTKNSTVTKQPVSFTKEPTNSIGSPGSLAQQIQLQQQQQQRSTLFPGMGIGGGGVGGNVGGGVGPLDEGLSIMCEFCGRCRCESCREPPPLPSRWLCDNACFCSAETALDYASCLCCVKGLFYHCGDGGSGVEADGEGAGSCADEPCSCTGARPMARWTCLGALALALPCLLCYWPLKGCVALCEACYARHASHGCRCDPSTAGRHLQATSNLRDSRDPEKRLLDPVTPEL